MTRLLDNAIRKLAELPEEKQDEMARLILERVESAQNMKEARPSEEENADPLPVGWLKGWKVPDTFFDPLPDDILDAFKGKTRKGWHGR